MASMLKRAIATGAITLASLALARSAGAQEPKETVDWGLALDVRRGPFLSIDGWWFSPGAVVDYRLTDFLQLRTKATGVVSSMSGEDDVLGTPDEYSLFIWGGMLRVLGSLDLGSTFAFRLGPVGAVLIKEHSSQVCVDDTYSELAVGVSSELVARVGEGRRIELGAQLDILPMEFPRCGRVLVGDGSLPVYDYGNEPLGNAGLFLGLAASYMFR